jgi:hypothetical protein
MKVLIGILLSVMIVMFIAAGVNYQQADKTCRLELALNQLYVNRLIGIEDPYAERRYRDELAKVLYPEHPWYQVWR